MLLKSWSSFKVAKAENFHVPEGIHKTGRDGKMAPSMSIEKGSFRYCLAKVSRSQKACTAMVGCRVYTTKNLTTAQTSVWNMRCLECKIQVRRRWASRPPRDPVFRYTLGCLFCAALESCFWFCVKFKNAIVQCVLSRFPLKLQCHMFICVATCARDCVLHHEQ